MLPIARRNAGGNPEGRTTLTAPGGAGHSEIAAACAGAADAAVGNTLAMMQIHFIALSFRLSLRRRLLPPSLRRRLMPAIVLILKFLETAQIIGQHGSIPLR